MEFERLIEIERFLHAHIPLTRTMGVRVFAAPGGGLAVEAPVALNYNHLHTAFGGSINAVATLAGYALLWSALRNDTAHIVIARSSIRFLRPVREQIRAVCSPGDEADLHTFTATLRAEGKARITLPVVVEENGVRAAEFQGAFVALRSRSTSA